MMTNIFKFRLNERRRKILFIAFFGLCVLVAIYAFFAQKAHAEYVYQVLQDTSTSNKLGFTIKKIWSTLMDMVNSVIVVVLIAVSFAEILRLNVNTYGIKKILPTLIFAVVAANFSFIIVRLVIDLGNVSLTFFSGKAHVGVEPPKWEQWVGYTSLFKNLLTNLLLLVEAVLLVILAILFLVRNWMLYFLAMVSGIAFMTIVLPQTKKLFDQWWTNLFKWTFMPLVSFMFLWLASLFSNLVDNTWIMGYVFMIVCLVAAITMPFKLGGSVMSGFYKYTGMQAGIGYAKKNWLDPAVKEGQDFLKEKWLGQASGSKYNPLGWMVRKSFETKHRRAEQERAVKGKENTAMREALGGKYDQYMSKKRQIAIAKRSADIDSDFGEEEWKKKDIERKYRETDDGKKSALNSVQYKFRMEAAENNLKILENEAMAFAQKPPGKGETNPYFDNHDNNDHWRRMHDEALSSRSALELSKMTTSKFEEDAMQEMEGQAYLTDMALTNYREWKNILAKLQAEGGSEEDIKRATEGMNEAKESWDKLMDSFEKQYWDNEAGKFKGLSATIERIIGKDGKFHRDIEDKDLQTLADSAGINKAHQGMFNDRRNKRFSGIVKQEAASVKGKRTAEDSIGELRTNGSSKKGFAGILRGDLRGLTESQIRKSFAELDNAITGAGDITNSSWVAVHKFIGEQQADAAREGGAAGNYAREQLGSKLQAAVGGLALNAQVYNSAKKQALDQAKTADYQVALQHAKDQALQQAKAEHYQSGSREVFDEANFKFDDAAFKKDYKFDEDGHMQSDAFKKTMEKTLKETVAKTYRVDQMSKENREAFMEHVEIKIDERGEIKADIANGLNADDEAARNRHADLMTALNEAVVNGTPRGVGGDAMRKYTAEARKQIPAGRREAGREMEDAYHNTDMGAITKKWDMQTDEFL